MRYLDDWATRARRERTLVSGRDAFGLEVRVGFRWRWPAAAAADSAHVHTHGAFIGFVAVLRRCVLLRVDVCCSVCLVLFGRSLLVILPQAQRYAAGYCSVRARGARAAARTGAERVRASARTTATSRPSIDNDL